MLGLCGLARWDKVRRSDHIWQYDQPYIAVRAVRGPSRARKGQETVRMVDFLGGIGLGCVGTYADLRRVCACVIPTRSESRLTVTEAFVSLERRGA